MHQLVLRTTLLAAALCMSAASLPDGGAAQGPVDDDRWQPAWGDWSLAFSLPSGGGAGLGFWSQRSPTLALGLTVDGTFTFRSLEDPVLGDIQLTMAQVSAGPALKRYWWTDSPVSPFLHAGLRADYRRSEVPGGAASRLGGSLSLGIGADWFPTEGLSIGGHTGVSAGYMLDTQDDAATGDESLLFVDLFTSALSLHLYF